MKLVCYQTIFNTFFVLITTFCRLILFWLLVLYSIVIVTMMAAALSTYYNNWDTLQTPNFEISSSFLEEPTPEELALLAPNYFPHHFAYSDETFFNLPNNSYLTDYPTNNFLYPEINNPSQLLPFTSFHDQQPFISLNEIFPTEHQDLPCPKRQKFEQEAMHMPCNYVVPNYCFQTEDQFSALLQHEVILPPEHSATNFVVGSEFEKKGKEERTVSAQSVAARERRRKITEKTQELGKLVPGGPKMNTAEMLHAASKYVKFLQAQVQMLQLINTLEVITNCHIILNHC